MAKTSLLDLQALFLYRYIDAKVAYLSEPFLAASFEFYSKQLNGLTTRSARADVCRQDVMYAFPDLIGQYYAQKMFSKAAEANAEVMVNLVKKAMGQALANDSWLDAKTRTAAQKKLAKVADLVGYSHENTTFAFQLRSDAYFYNHDRLAEDSFRTTLGNVGKAVDREAWGMSGAENNAYYDTTVNTIVFPAGILQSPYFDASYHPSRNYGGMGSTVGHELTHGFDDWGRLYDGDGNLAPWWTNATVAAFETRTKCFVDQYNAIKVYSNDKTKLLGHIDGSYTLGENLADSDGLKRAFTAYKQFMATNTVDNQGMSAKEADQLFFIAYGQSWCSKYTDAYTTMLIQTDPHAPAFARANGALQNNADFAKLFSCPVGSKMNPKTKCGVY